jgi:peptide/nickel transport system substrate-binding protein
MKIRFADFIVAVILGTLTACQSQVTATPVEIVESVPTQTEVVLPVSTPTSTPEPPRVLTVCSLEPASLFLYADTSSAARSILQAVYDGPFDMMNYEVVPVILEKMPSVQDGDVYLQPVEVVPGELMVDAGGNWVSLDEGILYKPSGCADSSCVLTYEGREPVQMDALVVQFQLLPGIRWSDGEPLTAADSVYSFNVFQDLYRSASPEVLRFTKSYTNVDERTVEWVGIPGYVGQISAKFFSPLPEHMWGGFESGQLLSSPLSNRTPMGWGAYAIDEWVAGDHITLSRNLNYFRIAEGLPHFDNVVYRFVDDGGEAIDALVIGECDFIDRTVLSELNIPRLQDEQAAGSLSFSVQTGTAWELAAFGIDTLNDQRVDFFDSVEVRQAIAMCIDRQKIVDELLFGISIVPDTYVPPNHPLYNEGVSKVEFDPEKAVQLLASVGWVDYDADPQTPLTSLGVPDIPDGTPLEFAYLVPSDAERPDVGQIIQEGLVGCGIGIEVITQEWDSLMMPGPDGPLFGRKFDMAQFAWSASFEPSCNLFTSDEIPGLYPDYPKGWGGANLAGYTNPEFDGACRLAMSSTPGSESYLQAHDEAQAIFSDDLPVIPLYQRIRLVAMRPDMCNVAIDPAANSALSHLELLDYGKSCE